jgi:uncharacterized protein (TIGR03083 family)
VKADEHIAALEREGALLADAADHRGLGAPVPACPGWQVRDLLRHLGYVHRWAAGYVGPARGAVVKNVPESEILEAGPPDAQLLGWFTDGLGDLVAALRSADPGLVCWTFFDAPSPLAFWARRQAHETAIHRADAQGAGNGAVSPALTPFPAGFAADGIDELLTGFAPRGKFRATTGESGSTRSMQVRATDTGDEWLIEIGARITARREPGPGECVLDGRASDLYLLLWNRLPDPGPVAISGYGTVLELWRARVRVTWN